MSFLILGLISFLIGAMPLVQGAYSLWSDIFQVLFQTFYLSCFGFLSVLFIRQGLAVFTGGRKIYWISILAGVAILIALILASYAGFFNDTTPQQFYFKDFAPGEILLHQVLAGAAAGLGVVMLLEWMLNRRNKTAASRPGSPLAAAGLIGVSAIAFIAIAYRWYHPVFLLFTGTVTGCYGLHAISRNRKTGIIYLIVSAFFVIGIPLTGFMKLQKAVSALLNDDMRYIGGCYVVPYPGYKGFTLGVFRYQIPLLAFIFNLFYFPYLALKRFYLRRRLMKEGVLPELYSKILKSKKHG